ncbi:Eco57I restriction-modification methylase domain-containing protein [Nodularia spumigena]|uniref:site-specific DNA-methyltransferase (adenine-specific) n=2 Tax=Nodularia spumigena TaxID=70799 RepID=A0A2S0Q9I7_NODSP|nr:N-6 DNA methylase [Nodularia spumigena]AVZ31024.1 type IIS restriction enzyme Eco57I [Nodularia spumigena UHCC 0039]
MSLPEFRAQIAKLVTTAENMLLSRRAGKPEENTKDNLITPFLDALGYTREYRTPEGSILSLIGTTTWVDYLLLPEVNQHPKLMFEAKSLWDKNIWNTNEQQVLDYLRNYSLDVGKEKPVLWIILSNFREWHILRLQDKKPFWSFTMEQMRDDPELVSRLYTCLSRDNSRSDRLEAFYSEKTREGLGTKFLTDLKIWRVILANGIKKSQPNLSLEKVREAAQVILNRFLLIRLLETFSREMPFNYLGRVYHNWQQTFPDLPFIEDLRRAFHNTWMGYNTELFQPSWIDQLMIDVEYIQSIIVINAVPQEGILYTITGTLANYRSIYNYDFTTLTQDILGTAYEQFLAHQLTLVGDVVKILENQQTRKREGIFYTPDYIVRRIVYQTLQPAIKPKIDASIGFLEVGDFHQAYTVASSVLDLTIIDPACGSGSFLLGAFDYILSEIKRYNQACKTAKIPDNFDLFNHVSVQPIINPEEQIMVRMLHGVDRDPQAVLLAKLSLWTKLLRSRPDEYGKRSGSIYSHLPALTLNIRVGDSLIHSPANLAGCQDSLRIAADLARNARDTNLKEIERNQAVTNLETKITSINQQINPVLTAFFASDESIQSVVHLIKHREANIKDLGLIRSFLTEAINPENLDEWIDKNLEDWTTGELARVKSALMTLENALEDVVIKRPFNWYVEFPHIFDPQLPAAEQGFFAVIGNPPYFNVDAIFGRNALELKWLRYAYPDIYTDKTDILFYFLRRGFDLLRENGYLSLIISRSFIQGDKSKSLRQFLSENTKVINITDFLGNRIFNAGIATCIFEYQKKVPKPEDSFAAFYVLNLDSVKEAFSSDDCRLDLSQGVTQVNVTQLSLDENRWEISPYREIFYKIDQSGTKLKETELVRYTEGITTGRDSIFEGKFAPDFPDNYLLQRVSTSSIYSFGCKPPGTQILYYTHDTIWEDLPLSIQTYLQQNQLELESRDVYNNQTSHYEWFHLHRPRYGMRDVKIIFSRRANANKFFVDEHGLFGFKSDSAAFVRQENVDIDTIYYICALLNSKVLEFRYRALGGIGKLTGKGMFEYFTQVGDLPIPQLQEPESNTDYQTLVQLSREAHQIWQNRYQIVTTYQSKASGVTYEEVSLNEYQKLTGDYATDIEWESPHPHREGHLLKLQIQASIDGYVIWGEMTDDEDWQEGNREWIEIARVSIRTPHLRRYLLARLIYLTEFDSSFRNKRKLSREAGNLVNAAFDVLKVNRYDIDRFSNLRALEVIEQRVKQEVGISELETVLLRQLEIKNQIDIIAYRLYAVEEYINIIEQALTVIL